ncbi:hypothetical protein MUY27_14555 [Mucilaginibacter sp. RS28]|uniref:Uncharacterized protein n=1 Tax=Mucilaginibacter straminoryzae TaxID=2932774 RepID=A0A9X1X5H9_9SPHI|nr:hypothetical protein [Mucilaginibacter straminoryzae]MCJ8210936.1 hypothetical protein [Mucilaginibacter straminoryzae]
MYKKLLSVILIILPALVKAQETVVIKHRLTDAVKEYIEVLKTDKNIRQGVYRAMLSEGRPLAIGAYTNNVKTGTWTFYDDQKHMLQRFNYDRAELTFQAPEDTSSFCRYVVDRDIKQGDTTTRPIRIGDRYYGYINYLKLFKLPQQLEGISNRVFTPVIELLVSPYGRLADFVVHLQSNIYPTQDVHMNIDALPDEDKIFIPASINREKVSCRIFITCYLTDSGQLDVE